MIRTNLKNAKTFLASKQYEAAKSAAISVIHCDPDNVTALLYKASAEQHMDQCHDARDTLQHLVMIKPDCAPAWLGLERVYANLNDRRNWIHSLNTLLTLFRSMYGGSCFYSLLIQGCESPLLFAAASFIDSFPPIYYRQDTVRITEILNKLIDVHLHDNNIALAEDAIRLQLPGSDIYHLLSNPPEPIQIWYRILDIHETHEINLAQQLIAKRSGIIGAPTKPVLVFNAFTEIALSSDSRISIYQNLFCLIKFSESPVHATRYLDLCITRHMAGLPDSSTMLSELASRMVDQAAPVPIAYRTVLDSMDISSVTQYPKRTLNGLIAAYSAYSTIPKLTNNECIMISQAACSSDTRNHDYINAASWILHNHEPEDLNLEMSGIFPALVMSFCSHDDDIALIASQHALNRITSSPLSYPNATCALRIRRAQIYLSTQRALDAQSELNYITWNVHFSNKIIIHQCRGDAAFQLGRLQDARDHFGFAQELIHSADRCERADFPFHLIPWVDSSVIWLDFLSETMDSIQAQKRMEAVDVTDLVGMSSLCSVYNYRLGRLCLANLEYELAHNQFLTAARLSPTADPKVFTYLGIMFMEHRNDALRASKCWMKALALNPNDGDAGLRLAMYFIIYLEDWDRAADALVSVTKSNCRDHSVWKRLGLVRMHQQQWEESVIAFQFAARTMGNKGDANVWSCLGEGYTRLNRWTSAIKALQKAYEINKDCAVTRYLLGLSYFKLGQYMEATSFLTPDYPPCLILLAQVYQQRSVQEYRSGRYKETAVLLTTGITLLESHTNRVKTGVLGKCLADLRSAWVMIPNLCPDLANQLRLAINEYQQFQLWDEAGAALFHLSQLDSDMIVLKEAESLLKQAIEAIAINDRGSLISSFTWNAMGCVQACRGQWLWAQHCWVLALNSNPMNLTVWTNLAKLYICHQDNELACEALHQALALDHSHPDPWILLGKANESITPIHYVLNTCLQTSPLVSQVIATTHRLVRDYPVHVEVGARRWVEWAPADPAAWNAIGCAYERAGNMISAERALKMAVKLDRNTFGVTENLVRVLSGLKPKLAYELIQRAPIWAKWGWSGHLVCAFAEHRSREVASFETLQRCMTEIDKNRVLPGASHFLAQLMYKASHALDSIPMLISDSAPGMLCALGMLRGNDAHVTSGFSRATRSESQYLASLHLLIQGDLIASQRALERARFMYPGSSSVLLRLTRFLGRYSPINRAQIRLALNLYQREHEQDLSISSSALMLASTGYLATGLPKVATSFSQRHVLAHPSSARAWRQLGVTLTSLNDNLSISMVSHIAEFPLRIDPGNAFSHILSSFGSYVVNPVDAMKKAKVAASLLSQSVGADNLPPVLYRQLARVLVTNNEIDPALSMLARGIDCPVASDLVSRTVHAGAILDVANLYFKLKWIPAARTLLAYFASNDIDIPAPMRIILMAASSAYHMLDLNSVKSLQDYFFELLGNEASESANQQIHVFHYTPTQQISGLLALATFKAGFKARGAKLMNCALRPDFVDVFRNLGGTVSESV